MNGTKWHLKKRDRKRVIEDMTSDFLTGRRGLVDMVLEAQAKMAKVVPGEQRRHNTIKAPEIPPKIIHTPVKRLYTAKAAPFHQIVMWNMVPGEVLRLGTLKNWFDGKDGRHWTSLQWSCRHGYSLGLFDHERPLVGDVLKQRWWLTAKGLAWWEIVDRNRAWRFRSLNTVWRWRWQFGRNEHECMVRWLETAVPFIAPERSRSWYRLPDGYTVEDQLWIPEHLRGEPTLAMPRRLSDRMVD